MNDEFPTTLTGIQKALEDKMMEVLYILESHYHKPMPIAKIEVESRLGLKLGFARKMDCLIKINRDLCDSIHWDEILNQALPHEVCHLVAPVIYNQYIHGFDKHEGWSHGRAWKECMRVLGLRPDRTAELDKETIQSVRVRTVNRNYVYGCPCGKEFNMTSILHNRIQIHGRSRRCRLCKGTIVFKGYRA